ncbi:hypothetical protein ACQR1W_16380 [Bradyrhizobium sp. HKCCYLS1011]|uniref:hypothetical protein n=1 Tax=Bradyrhizobium sp. HKCCYLS1011 TaxID=3420733 RepID=UPI003EBD69AB
MRAGSIAAIAALLIILAGAVAFAYLGLTVPGEPMPTQGWIALTLGVVVSLIVGIGLMALVFYSSRRGYDEAAQFRSDDRRD